jgi:PhnB protein
MSATAATVRSPAPKPQISGVTPYLTVDGAVRASEFYQRAFGATEVDRVPVDEKGRTMHVYLFVNGNSLMLSDPFPEHGHPFKGHEGCTLHMHVNDVDAWWKRAVDAGAQVVLPLQVMFWGDRYGQLRDPFGVLWSLAEPAAKS